MKNALVLAALAACEANLTPEPGVDADLGACLPNRDGQITADELPIALGATLTYYAGSNRTVDLVAHDGIYDLSMENPADTVVAIGPVALTTQWYAASFPNGEFVVDAGGGLDGTASHEQAPAAGETLVQYDAPIGLLRFPLVDGETYGTTATLVDTTIDGLPLQGSDQVDVDVAAGARLDVPYVQFSPILRVRTHVTRTPSTGTPVVGKRTTLFMFECFGEVARAESNDNEPNADFTSAAYLRRYALGATP